MKALCEEKLLSEQSTQWAVHVLKNQQFNHKLPRLIKSGVPGDAFIAHKTGELPGVEHDVGFMELKGRRAYVAVLLSNLHDNVAGQEAIGLIGKAVWDYLSCK